MAATAGGRLPDRIELGGRRVSLLDWKARNVRASYALAFGTVVLLAAIGYLAGRAFDPAAAVLYLGIAALVGGGQAAAAFFAGDRMALAAAGAREATRDEHRYLVNVSEAVAIGAGVPAPAVWVIDSPAPNAFATGRDPEHASIAVTTGLLELLDRQELEGVVAHEMAHIRNYDVRFLTLLAATIGAILILRDVIARVTWYGGAGGRGRRHGRGEGRGGGQAVALALLIVLLVLAPLLATLLRLAVSRRREFLADATGAYITRNPEGLARALEKIRDYPGERLRASEGVHHLFIVNPLRGRNARGLFATHPPIDERIVRLRSL